MQAVTTIGLDIAKSVFQVHGIDAIGNGKRTPSGTTSIERSVKTIRPYGTIFQVPSGCRHARPYAGSCRPLTDIIVCTVWHVGAAGP
jgi:hypothetical protein